MTMKRRKSGLIYLFLLKPENDLKAHFGDISKKIILRFEFQRFLEDFGSSLKFFVVYTDR